MRARCEVILHVRHFAVGEDLVRTGNTQVHVFRRPHFDLNVVAFGQLGDCFCPGFTANEHLRTVRNLAFAETVDNAGGFRDSTVFNDSRSDLCRLLVWRAHRAVQGVVSPGRAVHTNAICFQPRGVHSGEVMLVAPWQCGCPGGCEFLDCRAALRDGQGRLRLRVPGAQAVAADRGEDRCVRVVDVEKRAVDRGDSFLATWALVHDVIQRRASRNSARIPKVGGKS